MITIPKWRGWAQLKCFQYSLHKTKSYYLSRKGLNFSIECFAYPGYFYYKQDALFLHYIKWKCALPLRSQLV